MLSYKYITHTAALLFAGSFVALCVSCGGKTNVPHPEAMVTAESDSLFSVQSKNGLKNHRVETPKMIEYGLAKEPYSVYPEGIFVETFRDSTEQVESSLLADHVVYYKTRELWEAIGNVVATGEDGRTLYTEQLFWDEKTERIYSNVNCKIVQKDGVHIGEGLESDQALKHWKFRNAISKLEFDAPGNSSSSDTGQPIEGATMPEYGTATPDTGTEEQAQSGSEQTESESTPPRRTIQPVEGDEATFNVPSPTPASARTSTSADSLRQQRSGFGPSGRLGKTRETN